AEPPSIGELRIDCSIERNDIACRTVSDRNRTSEVDGIDDVETRSFQRCDRGRGNAERFINAECIEIAHKNGKENVGTEARYIFHRIGMQIERLALRADKTGIEQRKGVASDLYIITRSA